MVLRRSCGLGGRDPHVLERMMRKWGMGDGEGLMSVVASCGRSTGTKIHLASIVNREMGIYIVIRQA